MASFVIEVHFDGHSWKVVPDPARVHRGDLVSWLFQSPLAHSDIQWSVYFPKKVPFHNGRELTATSDNSGASTDALATAEEGEFKYDVRAVDKGSQREIGRDDPMLIVLR
jgi:hypothetical protein